MRTRNFTLESADPAEIRALAEPPADVGDTVAAILADVRERGDEAVRELTRRYDGEVAALRVPQEELDAALAGLDPEVRVGLDAAIANVRARCGGRAGG